MYRITNITDREDNIKQDFIDELKQSHPELVGEILYPELVGIGDHLCFDWNDDTNKILRTSTIEEYSDNIDTVKVVTRNSIYYLQKENNKNR